MVALKRGPQMEATRPLLFDAVLESDASALCAGRIRFLSAPGLETDCLTEIGHFRVGARAAGVAIDCFVGAEYRSSRRAIEEAIRALAARPSERGIPADASLRFFWMTPEPEREAAGPPALAPLRPLPASTGPVSVSYIPDTDERITVDKKS